MNYQLFILILLGFCSFAATGQTPFMDSSCKGYVQKDMVKGSFEQGRGIDRSYDWDLIKDNYQEKANELQALVKSGVSIRKKYCQGYPNPPSGCSSFQAHCIRELKNRGLGDLFQAWSLRLEECINNPDIIHNKKTVKYKEVYGKNCEPEKVIRNVKGVQYIKRDFDKMDSELPDDVRALWEELNQRYSEWENSLDQLAAGREAVIKNEDEKDAYSAAKSKTDKILDECKHHFDINLAGHSTNAICDGDESKPFSQKNQFKKFIQEIDDLSNAQDIVINVADKDIEKAVIARLYIALVIGEAKHDKASLSKALCSIKGEKSRYDFCSSKFSKKRNELVEKAMSVLPAKIERFDADAEMKNINSSLSEIKPLCHKIQRAKANISISYFAGGEVKDTAHNKAFIRKFRKDNQESKKQLAADVRSIYVEKLMANSKIPGMLGTDALKGLRLNNTVDDCNIKPVTKKDVWSAVYQARKIALENINENIEHRNQANARKNQDRLKDILRVNPQGVYSAILDNKNPELASFVCNTLREQKIEDRNSAIAKGVVVGALVASSVIPGVGFLSVPLATALTAVELIDARDEFLTGKKDERAYIQQGVANQFVDFDGLDAADGKVNDAISNAALEIALEWGTVGVGKALKTTSNLIKVNKVRKANQVNISKVDYKKLTNSGKSNVDKFLKENILSTDFSRSISRFANDPVSSEYIRIFTSKMSPDEVRRFFNELSRFKSPKDFIAFSKNISKDQIGSVDDFFIAMGKYKSNGKELELLAEQTSKKLKDFEKQNKNHIVVDESGNIKNLKEHSLMVKSLKAGDSLRVSPTKEFKIKRVVSEEGSANQIFELEDGSILRVGKSKVGFKNRDLGPGSFIDGVKELENGGVNTAKILEADPNGNWVRVEKIEFDKEFPTFQDYLRVRKDLPADKVKELDESFYRFAESTSDFEKIDDFHPENIGLTKDGDWVLFDANRGNKLVEDMKDQSNAFRSNADFREMVDPEIVKKAEERIFAKRGLTSGKTDRLPATSKEFKEMSVKNINDIDNVPETYLNELNEAVYDDFLEGYYRSNSSGDYIETLNKMHGRYKSYGGNTSGSKEILEAGKMRASGSKTLIYDIGANYRKASASLKKKMTAKGQNQVFKSDESFPENIKKQFNEVSEMNNASLNNNISGKKNYLNKKLEESGQSSITSYIKTKYNPTEKALKDLKEATTSGGDLEVIEAFRIIEKYENRKLLDGIINSSGDKPLTTVLDSFNLNHGEIKMVEGIPKGHGTKVVEIKTSNNSKAHKVLVFPKGNQLDIYKKTLNDQMSFLKKNQKQLSQEEFTDKVAEFYHTGINAHLFPRGNNSLLMTQINVMMKARGMKSIPHGSLDFRAFVQDVDDFKNTFKEALK